MTQFINLVYRTDPDNILGNGAKFRVDTARRLRNFKASIFHALIPKVIKIKVLSARNVFNFLGSPDYCILVISVKFQGKRTYGSKVINVFLLQALAVLSRKKRKHGQIVSPYAS
ncbi:hypothetical protein SUGI_0150240 [Cryptomeria japonica]|nr:hypothetical protein SUGI_0150240 [Cryptomeria japonica]